MIPSLTKNNIRSSIDIILALEKICGSAYVNSQYHEREEISRVTIPTQKICQAVVRPASSSEITEILKVANDFQFKVWVFSGGKNWGYGTMNALKENAIVVLLNRMNKILEVNEKLAYAVIEPGVTQAQLNSYLKENKSNLWMDCTDSTPESSIIGNALERGYGYTPYGDHFAQLCGLEIILPNGDLIRSGGSHGYASDQSKKPWSETWNTFQNGLGPNITGLFSQSNFGIVVKAGIFLMPKPEKFLFFNFEINDAEKLPGAIDAFRKLSLNNTLNCHIHMVNEMQQLTLVRKYPYELLKENETCLSDSAIKSLREKHKIKPWLGAGALYGTKARVKVDKKELIKTLSLFGKLEFIDDNKFKIAKFFIQNYSHKNPIIRNIVKFLKPLITEKPIEFMNILPGMFHILQGIPNETIIKSAYFKSKLEPGQNINPAKDQCGIIWCTPTIPMTGEHVSKILNLVKPIFQQNGFEFMGCLTIINKRTLVLLMGIFYDQKNEEEIKRAKKLHEQINFQCQQSGYASYRAGLMEMGKLNQDNIFLQDFLKKIKQTIDPNQILAPKKYGI